MAQSTAPPASPSQQTQPQTPQGGVAPGAPPLKLQDLPPDEHTLTPEEQAQVQRQQAYQAALRVANLTARWGPAMSTPGVSISLVEKSRAKTASGATQITYQIAGSGFRAGERLNLVRWPLGDAVQTEMGGVVLNPQGIAVCGAPAPAAAPSAPAQPPATGLHTARALDAGATPPPGCSGTMQPNEPVQLQVTAAPGEAVRAALIAEDRSNGAAAQAVPFPIANSDKGCSLQVLLAMKNADMVVVEGTGFPPSSTVSIETVTGAQTLHQNSKTDGAGHLALAIMPGASGQSAGTTTVRYAGVVAPASSSAGAASAPAATGCAPAVSFPWGSGSYKPQ